VDPLPRTPKPKPKLDEIASRTPPPAAIAKPLRMQPVPESTIAMKSAPAAATPEAYRARGLIDRALQRFLGLKGLAVPGEGNRRVDLVRKASKPATQFTGSG